jgi:thymidylate synthase (FAD)
MGTDSFIIESARMSTGRGFEGWDPGEICKRCRVRPEEVQGQYNVANFCSGASEPHEWETTKGDQSLLEYLLANRHTTPFEMCEFVIEVQAPIMVFREWHRHRTQSYSEFSARYAIMPNLHYIPGPDRIQKQSKHNKQGSAEPMELDLALAIAAELDEEQQSVYERYDRLATLGVAKEIARIDTPVSRYSKMRAKTDLWNWLGFLNLREDGMAQWEIRQYALIVSQIIKALFPRVHGLWEEHMRYAVRFSRTEHRVLRDFLTTLPKESQMVLASLINANLPDKKAEGFFKKLMNAKE